MGRAETVEAGDSRIQTHMEHAIQPAQYEKAPTMVGQGDEKQTLF